MAGVHSNLDKHGVGTLTVYNATTGRREHLQQGMVASTATSLMDGTYYKDCRIAHNANNDVEYLGLHQTMGASTSGTGWVIQKISWSGQNITRVQTTVTGTWDNRVSLFDMSL